MADFVNPSGSGSITASTRPAWAKIRTVSQPGQKESRRAPVRTTGILSDIRNYFLHKPVIPTLFEFATSAGREEYSYRIMQRTGISVDEYSVLNIHRIAVDAPVKYVFEELLDWDAESPFWPVHVVEPELVDGDLRNIRMLLLGGLRRTLGDVRRFLGGNFGTLFRLTALRFQHVPDPFNFDNARYLLYRCSGGYPMGILIIYVRSSIAAEGETGPAQLFFAVGFNFYGKKEWPRIGLVNRVWESIHNRVTANVLNRFKQLCEARFDEVRQEITE